MTIPFIYCPKHVHSAHPYALNVNPGQHNRGRKKKKEGTSEGTEETHSRSKRNEIVTPHLAVSPLAALFRWPFPCLALYLPGSFLRS